MSKGLQHIARMVEFGQGEDAQFFRNLHLGAPGVLHNLLKEHKQTRDPNVLELHVQSEVSVIHQSRQGTAWFYIKDRKVVYYANTLSVNERELNRLAARLVSLRYCDEEPALT